MRRFGLALVPVLICALTTQALGAMPANTIIMGDKAFDVSLLNDASMVTEILNAFIAAGNQFIYKTVSGSFISVMGQPVDPSTLPAVTYKDANKVAIQYSAGDSAATSTLGLAFGENVVSQGASKYILLPSNPAAGRPFGAIASVAGATLTYSSSNPSVATVSASGVVTGVSDGQASITVTASLAGYLTTTAQVLASVSHISAVTASNGRISVTLDGAPTVAPRNTDFAIIEVKSGTRVPSANLTLHSYDAATGVASLTVTPVTQWLTSIQYAVSYCSSVEWVTDSILAIPGVSSVTGTNGSVNVVLDWVPGADPVREDFVITKNVSSSSTWGEISSSDVRLASWNASTRTATLTFPVSPPTAVDQVFRYAASYRGGNAAQMTSWITVVGVVIPIEVGLQAYTSWAISAW